MKKLLSLLLVLAMAFMLVACGGGENVEETEVSQTETQTEEKEETAAEEEKAEVERLNPTGGSITIGDKTITAEYLPFEEPFFYNGYTKPAMGVNGNNVYVGDGKNTIKVYTYDGTALTYVKTLNVENEVSIEFDKDGNFYTKGGVFAAKKYDAEGTAVGEAAASGEISVSKTTDLALTYFPGKEEITKISGGASAPWIISGLKTAEPKGPFKEAIYEIEIIGDHILVAGLGKENDKTLAVFDLQGNQIAISNEALAGNNTNAITETPNGYIASAVNKITLLAKDGTVIGKGDGSKEFFGTEGTVWIEQMHTFEDGTTLAYASVPREDSSRDFVMFKLTGF